MRGKAIKIPKMFRAAPRIFQATYQDLLLLFVTLSVPRLEALVLAFTWLLEKSRESMGSLIQALSFTQTDLSHIFILGI